MSDEPAAVAGHRAGFVAVVGRPNVGKSTLVNRMVGQKVAIVSDKPQTTRNRILAVVHRPAAQIVLFDTPGIHKPEHRLNERMVEAALRSLARVEVVLWLVDVQEPLGPGDRYVARLLRGCGKPVLLGINKIDAVARPAVLPVIASFQSLLPFEEVVPLSGRTGDNVDRLERLLIERLPESPPLYPDDFVTDLPERFFAGEIVRESILKLTRDELPYTTGVLVETFKEEEKLVRIEASILVERETQKAIVIGKGGSMLKQIGTQARLQLEDFLGAKVFLGLFVKVREHWRDDRRMLEEMGLTDRDE